MMSDVDYLTGYFEVLNLMQLSQTVGSPRDCGASKSYQDNSEFLLCLRHAGIFMLTKQQKQQIIEELTDKIKRQKVLVFTDPGGLKAGEMEKLKKELGKSEIDYDIARILAIPTGERSNVIKFNTSSLSK